MSDRHARFASPERALVRTVADTFSEALRRDPVPLDASRARAQHAAYVAALAEAGVAVRWVEPAPACPDGVFVEDPAVVVDGVAWLTLPGAPSRRAEVASVGAALASEGLDVRRQSRGVLDGGDVLRVGETLFVGVSSRTDAEGIAALAAATGREVVPVPVRDGLHLKSGATLAAPGLVVLDPSAVDRDAFERLEVLEVDEPEGANVLALADRVLVSASAPRTAALLTARGLAVVVLELSELHKADGALTCLSLRIPPRGSWCV